MLDIIMIYYYFLLSLSLFLRFGFKIVEPSGERQKKQLLQLIRRIARTLRIKIVQSLLQLLVMVREPLVQNQARSQAVLSLVLHQGRCTHQREEMRAGLALQ